jgi:hypothetical protein
MGVIAFFNKIIEIDQIKEAMNETGQDRRCGGYGAWT